MSESSSTSANNLETIQLIIRCALQTFEDLNISCPVEWKVAQLKRHLFEICSTKPDPQRQRLIYAGHCLQDSQTLREIVTKASEGFEPGEEIGPQVIHFVCSSRDTAPQTTSGLRHRATASSATTSTPSTTLPTAGINAAGQQGFFMPNGYPAHGFPQYQIPANATPEQMAYYSSMMTYQQAVMAWMQYSQMTNPTMVPQLMGAMNPLYQAGPYNVQLNVQHAGQVPVQPQMIEQNLVQNNPAPPANEDEPINDILGILYKSIRVIFFLMVLFIYSSFERFIAVFLIVCILWYVHRQREQNNLAAGRGAQAPLYPPMVNNDELREILGQQNDNNNNEIVPPANQQPVEHPQVQTPWNLFCSTVSSFFLSLIPENPVPIDVGE